MKQMKQMKQNSKLLSKLLGLAAVVCLSAMLFGMTTMAASVQKFTVGKQINKLDTGSDVRYYQFTVKRPGVLQLLGTRVSSYGSYYGLDVRMCNSKGKALDRYSSYTYINQQNPANSRVAAFALNKGTYRIKVQTGDVYSIATAFTSFKEKSGSKESKAVSLKKKRTVKGVLGLGESGKKADYYKITLKKPAKIYLDIKAYGDRAYVEIRGAKSNRTSIYGKTKTNKKTQVTTFTCYGRGRRNLPKGSYIIKISKIAKKSYYSSAYEMKWRK